MSSWGLLHVYLHRQVRSRLACLAHRALLVGVSGGQDSLCLLKLLMDLQDKWHWQLGVVHCNHQWRSDAAANADFVEQLCHQWRIPFHGVTAPTLPPNEAAARQWRYQVFAALAGEQGYAYILTGHTATDRAETLLYNLVRGSGADGMQALSWQRALSPDYPHLQLVRPLLGISRATTGEFCQAFQIPVWEDSTNQDRGYVRNRIRLEVMPYLQTHFNPQVEHTLAQTAEILAAEVDMLEHLTDALYQQAVIPTEFPAPWRLRRDPLKTAPLALQRRVCRRVLQARGKTQVTFDQVEKLVNLIHAPQRSQTDPFPGGAIARVEGEFITLY